ncbi:hypothetical protein PR202_gb27617 [Eleusine coracana subsp. coracana]|uniref:RING-type E3 ubiquitin transferase n=1 Tax=Eleusine coracana subsp. coracana TaxID=191504 RepID=A0AAV5FV87_ELECO|nr:hypothetical protein QOZ80_6AG0542080 [Eleusine coracana subsp. coracana]GJN38562.1 hypothetical protein PR202_gb27617 [Eleusine coracana subsp. coracana]
MSTGDSSTSAGGAIAGVSIAIGVFLLVLAFMCSLCHGYRTSRENSAAAAAALAAGPPEPAAAGYWDDDDEQEARRRGARRDHGRLRRSAASPTAGLPSFTYKPSVSKHNLTGGGGGGEETCSVCLGAFQAGETVRLLPVCLHLYHVDCIDPWLNVHSTCPICRSGIDSPMDGGGLLPPV